MEFAGGSGHRGPEPAGRARAAKGRHQRAANARAASVRQSAGLPAPLSGSQVRRCRPFDDRGLTVHIGTGVPRVSGTPAPALRALRALRASPPCCPGLPCPAAVHMGWPRRNLCGDAAARVRAASSRRRQRVQQGLEPGDLQHEAKISRTRRQGRSTHVCTCPTHARMHTRTACAATLARGALALARGAIGHGPRCGRA